MLTHDVCSWWRQSPYRNVGHLEIVLRKDHLHILETELVGGLEHEFYDFPCSVGHVIIRTDDSSIIFQRGGSTTNQWDDLFGTINQQESPGKNAGGGFSIQRWSPSTSCPYPRSWNPWITGWGHPGEKIGLRDGNWMVFDILFHYKSCVYLCISYILSIIIIHIKYILYVSVCRLFVDCIIYAICIYACRIHDLQKDRCFRWNLQWNWEFPISSCPSQDLIVAYDTNKYRKEYETYVKARPSQGWSCWISWWSFGR